MDIFAQQQHEQAASTMGMDALNDDSNRLLQQQQEQQQLLQQQQQQHQQQQHKKKKKKKSDRSLLKAKTSASGGMEHAVLEEYSPEAIDTVQVDAK
jgi:hypothetical protein